MAASKEGAKSMILAVLFFSVAHASVKALDRLPFYELVFLRQCITFGLAFYMIRRLGLSPWGKNRGLLVARGLLGTTALAGYFYSLHNMPLASAVTVQYLSPIATLVFSQIFLGEKAAFKKWVYFFIAFLGVAMVKGFDTRIESFTMSVALVAVVFSALAYTSVRALKSTDHELVIVLYFPLVTLPIFAPWALLNWVMPVGHEWFFVGIVGVFTFLAQVYMTKAYQTDRAEDVGIFNYLGLVMALGIGYLGFGETHSHWALGGMALIVCAVYLATRPRRQ